MDDEDDDDDDFVDDDDEDPIEETWDDDEAFDDTDEGRDGGDKILVSLDEATVGMSIFFSGESLVFLN